MRAWAAPASPFLYSARLGLRPFEINRSRSPCRILSDSVTLTVSLDPLTDAPGCAPLIAHWSSLVSRLSRPDERQRPENGISLGSGDASRLAEYRHAGILPRPGSISVVWTVEQKGQVFTFQSLHERRPPSVQQATWTDTGTVTLGDHVTWVGAGRTTHVTTCSRRSRWRRVEWQCVRKNRQTVCLSVCLRKNADSESVGGLENLLGATAQVSDLTYTPTDA